MNRQLAALAATPAESVDILDDDPRRATRVLLGDFNAPPDAPELDPLRTAVTVSDNIRVRSAVVPDDPDVVAASDHRPVLADLRLSRRG